MASFNYTSCCGIDEIDGICDCPPHLLMKKLCNHFFGGYNECGAYLFTDAECRWKIGDIKFPSGEALKDYIEKNSLGTVSFTDFHNPNSGNDCRAYVWVIDLKKLKAFNTQLKKKKK